MSYRDDQIQTTREINSMEHQIWDLESRIQKLENILDEHGVEYPEE
jgi:hypothetical protein